PATLGNHSLLVQKERERDGMFLEELARLEKSIPLFRRNVGQLRARLRNFVFDRLDLSHALHAIWSPGTPQELRDQRAAAQKSGQSQYPLAVGCFQGKLRSP